jgi:hypothetical protein
MDHLPAAGRNRWGGSRLPAAAAATGEWRDGLLKEFL